MDAFAAVHHLALKVQEVHLFTQAYLADPDRRALHLTTHLLNIRSLLRDLGDYVFGQVPDAIFTQHWRDSVHLEEALLALEAGFIRDAQLVQQNRLAGQQISISEATLREMVHLGFRDKEIAGLHGCSVKTVYRRRRRLALPKYLRQHVTPDQELGNYILGWWRITDAERTGSKLVMGWLKSHRIPCTRRQIRRVMRELNPDNHLARGMQAVQRREYNVPFPNSLWHIDGNHKLIRYKFVIHGGIDGFSSLVTFMGVSDNNRAGTVRQLFVAGAQRHGWPSRVRADYGGENLGVKQIMEATRGLNRGSFITGKSTHNQRIERLWRDVRNGFIRRYYAIFQQLERVGALDVDNALHLYCLHHVFLPLIQHSVDEWVKAWNYHGVSTKGRQGNKHPLRAFRLARALAEQQGYHLDFFPYGRGDAQEVEWFAENRQEPLVNLADYELYNNGEGQERDPDPQDPHVLVDRFADDLPPELYTEEFLGALQENFPVKLDMTSEEAHREYINCLGFVERCLHDWFPNGPEAL